MPKKQKYYFKTVNLDMTTKNGFKWKLGWNELGNDNPLIMCENGLHVYKSLEDINTVFYPRIFLAEIGDEFVDGGSEKVCARKVRLVEEITPRHKLWEKLRDEFWAYQYCCDVKDRKEVRKHITDPYWIEMYEKRFGKKLRVR